MDSFWEIWNFHEKVGRKKTKERHDCISSRKFIQTPKNGLRKFFCFLPKFHMVISLKKYRSFHSFQGEKFRFSVCLFVGIVQLFLKRSLLKKKQNISRFWLFYAFLIEYMNVFLWRNLKFFNKKCLKKGITIVKFFCKVCRSRGA